MTDFENHAAAYRTVDLPGLGQVLVPHGVTDAQVLEQVLGEPVSQAPKPKSKKVHKKP